MRISGYSMVVSLAVAQPSVLVAQERPPIIDMHMHANSSMRRDADGVPLPRPCMPMPCQGPPGQATTAEEVLALTLEAMDRHNIVLGFLSQWPLDNVYRWVEAAPDRFIASPTIFDPDLIDLTIALTHRVHPAIAQSSSRSQAETPSAARRACPAPSRHP